MAKSTMSEQLNNLVNALYIGISINSPVMARKTVIELNKDLNLSPLEQVDDVAFRKIGKKLDILYSVYTQQINN